MTIERGAVPARPAAPSGAPAATAQRGTTERDGPAAAQLTLVGRRRRLRGHCWVQFSASCCDVSEADGSLCQLLM
jgi:hypothetical protein